MLALLHGVLDGLSRTCTLTRVAHLLVPRFADWGRILRELAGDAEGDGAAWSSPGATRS